MRPDNNKHLILVTADGSSSAIPCTLATAQKILETHLPSLDPVITSVADQLTAESTPELASSVPQLISAAWVAKVLSAVLYGKEGEPLALLRQILHGNRPTSVPPEEDPRPEVHLTKALQEEVVLWAFRNKQLLLGVSGQPESWRLAGNVLEGSFGDLSLFEGLKNRAKGRQVKLVDDYYLSAAKELLALRRNRWAETAKEAPVVERFLDFVTTYLVSDELKFAVIPLEHSYE